MPFAVLVIGAIILIAAFNNSFSDLATELEQDLPGFFKWMLAIVVILGIGYAPGMKVPSRWIMGLVALVIVLTQWSKFQAAFTSATQGSGSGSTVGAGAPDPTAAYVASGGTSGTPTASEIAGASSTASGATAPTQLASAAATLAANPLNPNSYIGLAAGFGGLANG
jgi:hypothetical protein